jgi:hypothetical protein
MKRFSVWCAGVVVAFVSGGSSGTAWSADDVIYFFTDTFAAIAYSEETGRWGYTYDHTTLDNATILARRHCKAADAKTVAWVHNGFCALAVGENGTWGTGWSSGDGATNTAAKQQALAECKKRSKTARLVICVCSADRTPEFFETPDPPATDPE